MHWEVTVCTKARYWGTEGTAHRRRRAHDTWKAETEKSGNSETTTLTSIETLH